MQCFLKYAFILLVFGNSILRAEVYMNHNEATWSSATKICDLATPDILIDTSGRLVLNDVDPLDQDVWVGYYMTETPFEYFGCSPLPSKSTFYLDNATPGLCHSMCKNHMAVGVTEDKCVCLLTIDLNDTRKTFCDETCSEQGIACGSDQTMSLYKINLNASGLLGTNSEDRCLMIDKESHLHEYRWKKCDDRLLGVCKLSSMLKAVMEAGKTMTWIESTKQCFDHNGSPVPFIESSSTFFPPGKSWTSVVRSGAIRRFQSFAEFDSHVNEGPVKFGFLESGNKLKFEDYHNRTLRILCIKASANQSAPESNTSTSLNLYPRTQTNKEEIKPNAKSSAFILPLSISIACVVLAVVVIAIIVVIRKRRVKSCLNSIENQQTEHLSINRDDTGAVSSDKGIECVLGDKHRNNDYANEYEVALKDYREAKDPACEGTYDVTGEQRDGFRTDTDNLYNKLDADNSDYSHIERTGKIKQGNIHAPKPDNPYSKTEAITRVTDITNENEYNVVSDFKQT